MGIRLSHIPLRLTTGAFILNSGLGKRGLDKDSAAGMQGMASTAFPQVAQLEPEKFGRIISMVEIGLGAALLTPFVPSRLAGLALTAFSSGMMAMYFKMPGMTQEDGVRPTQDGTAIAKDIWMLGIGLGLLLDRKS